MQEIMKLAHEFLQNFCAGNQQNQTLLHKHLSLFLNTGVSFKLAAFLVSSDVAFCCVYSVVALFPEPIFCSFRF